MTCAEEKTPNAEAEDFREIFDRTPDRDPASDSEASAWLRMIRKRLGRGNSETMRDNPGGE